MWIRENLKRLFQKTTGKFLVKIVLYPITMFFSGIYRLGETLASLSVLKKGKWENLCFSVRTGLSYLFYDTQALNFEYFNRKATSPYLGLGDYPISRWFSYSKIALIIAKRGKPIIVPVCMLLWLCTHALWIQLEAPAIVLICMGLILISSTFFQHAFTAQNYNVLGWFFFPIGLYGLLTGNLQITCVGWLGAGLFSITALTSAAFFTLAACIWNASYLPILTLIPGFLVIFVQFMLSLDFKNLKDNVNNILQRIGASEKSNAYKRTTTKGLKTGVFYFLFSLCALLGCFYFQTGSLPWQGLVALVIMLINGFIFRFADPQSIQAMLMTIGFTITIENPSLLQGVLFWILIAPPALIFYGTQKMKDMVIMPERRLKSIEPIMQGMQDFLSPVKTGQTVFFAFDDPKGIYENLFDGYRWLIEVPAYIATKRKFLFLPTWWTVFESMTQTSPKFWGRSVEDVKRYLATFHASFAIIYQENEEELAPAWENNGFVLVNKFSWKDHIDLLNTEKVILKEPPVWFLLQKKPNEI